MPRRLAIKARTSLSDHPATVPESSPHPSPARAAPITVCSIPAIMASSSALVVPSIPLPLPGAYKRSRPSPIPSTPAPAISSASPRANRASTTALPRRSGEPRSPLPSEFWSNNLVLELCHTLTRHSSPPPIAPDCLTGDLTAVNTRHRDRPP
jgi:hypothetical protein